MSELPVLDAHAHLADQHPVANLVNTGYVLAMSLSLKEGEQARVGQFWEHNKEDRYLEPAA